ncbi:MAG: protein-glutamine glutaminase family protein [Bdellovibrionota bacterium]
MLNSRYFRSKLVTMLFLATWGLGAVADSATAEKTPRAALTEILQDLDYLPLNYAKEAAFLSTLYVSLEILVRTELPVATQYAEMVPTENGPQRYFAPTVQTPEKTVYWRYHGAPIVWLENEAEPLIVDPFFARVPMKRSEWLKWLNPSDGEAHLAWASAGNLVYNLNVRPNVGISERSQIPSQKDSATLSSLDLNDTCGWIKDVIKVEPGLEENLKDAKIEKLVRRSEFLVEKLVEKGLFPEGYGMDCW